MGRDGWLVWLCAERIGQGRIDDDPGRGGGRAFLNGQTEGIRIRM